MENNLYEMNYDLLIHSLSHEHMQNDLFMQNNRPILLLEKWLRDCWNGFVIYSIID